MSIYSYSLCISPLGMKCILSLEHPRMRDDKKQKFQHQMYVFFGTLQSNFCVINNFFSFVPDINFRNRHSNLILMLPTSESLLPFLSFFFCTLNVRGSVPSCRRNLKSSKKRNFFHKTLFIYLLDTINSLVWAKDEKCMTMK